MSSDTPRTDTHKAKMPSGINGLQEAVWIANQHLEFARTLERQNAELLAALKFAREEIASFPRSFAYDVTHLPRIDEAIRRAEG